VVRELNDTEALQLALVENLQREDLNPVEETEGILQLLAQKLNLTLPEIPPLLYQMKNAFEKDKGKDSDVRDNVIPNPASDSEQGVQGVFDKLGLMSWYSFTCNRLPLLRLPENLLEALRRGEIEYTKAKAIALVKDEASRLALLEDVIAQSLSLREIRERVKAVQSATEPPPLAKRMETIYKLAKKHHVWDDPSKHSRLESLLAQIEELIASGGLDRSRPKKEGEATRNEPPPTVESLQDSSPLESGKDFLESRKDATEQLTAELPQPSEETASVLSERKTPSSEPLDESRPDAKEELTYKGSEAIDELLNSSLTHTQMVERLGVKSSTLGDAKKKPNFASWSKSKDPDAIAWQWVTESKCFVPLKNSEECAP
jgi:ParB-like chromosome segregation protein Spo0J